MSISMENIPENASQWLAEAGSGLTAARKAALADWLRESPAHVHEFLQTTLIQQEIGHLGVSPEQLESWVRDARSASGEPTRIALASEPGIASRGENRGGGTDRGARTRVGWLAAASLVVAALLAAVMAVRWESGRYSTALGEQRIVTLADGSVLELNTDSILEVRYTRQQRAIRMVKGEAFFRVAHETARPFVVTAGAARVQAVGTQFNVRMSTDSTLVSVVEGAVEVREQSPAVTTASTATGADAAVRVTTGEEVSITPLPLPDVAKHLTVAKLAMSSPQRSTSWTRGRVEFENTPLGDVMSEFQRYGTVRVVIDDDSIRQLKLTGSFDAHDPDSALAYIATLPGIAVEEVDSHTFRVFHRDRPRIALPSKK